MGYAYRTYLYASNIAINQVGRFRSWAYCASTDANGRDAKRGHCAQE